MEWKPYLAPTLADETIAAREELTLGDSVAMALRSHRAQLGESQRTYAARRGWTATQQARLERHPGSRRLEVIEAALCGTGFRLGVVPDDMELEVAPESWPTSELLARDTAGRRLPAHVFTRRVGETPSWHIVRQGPFAPPPQWTWQRPWD